MNIPKQVQVIKPPTSTAIIITKIGASSDPPSSLGTQASISVS